MATKDARHEFRDGRKMPFLWMVRQDLDYLAAEVDSRKVVSARSVYMALAEIASECHDGEHEGFRASTPEIAAKACVSERTARDLLTVLRDIGVVQRWENQLPNGGTAAPTWILRSSPESASMRPATVAGGVAGAATVAAPTRAGDPVKNEELIPSGSVALTLDMAMPTSDPVVAVFEHWRSVMGKGRATLTTDRRRRIRARLRTYRPEQLCEAIDKVAADPFYMGDNDRDKAFNDFKTIFKSDGMVEEFLLAEAPKRRVRVKVSSLDGENDPKLALMRATRLKMEGKDEEAAVWAEKYRVLSGAGS